MDIVKVIILAFASYHTLTWVAALADDTANNYDGKREMFWRIATALSWSIFFAIHLY